MGFDTVAYVNQNGGVVHAHVVTADETGTTVRLAYGQGTYDVVEGDILLTSYRPNEWEKAPSDFNDNYTVQDGEGAQRSTSTTEEFDPSSKSATEVRNYLSDTSIDQGERNRVADAERDGKNRATAFPA